MNLLLASLCLKAKFLFLLQIFSYCIIFDNFFIDFLKFDVVLLLPAQYSSLFFPFLAFSSCIEFFKIINFLFLVTKKSSGNIFKFLLNNKVTFFDFILDFFWDINIFSYYKYYNFNKNKIFF